MEQFRIGRDLYFQIALDTAGLPQSLENADLCVCLLNPVGSEIILSHTIDGNNVTFEYPASLQKYVGTYKAVVWYNKGKKGQLILNKPRVFRLVASSQEEIINGAYPGERAILSAENLFVGITGPGSGNTSVEFTASQLRALNSGITADKLANIEKKLNNMHKMLSQSAYDTMEEDGDVMEGTVYFIEGEDKIDAIYFNGLRFEGGAGEPEEIDPEYDTPVVTLNYGSAGTTAGTLTPTVTIKQKWRKKYDNGTAAEQTELSYTMATLPSGATLSFAGSNAKTGVSVNAASGVVTYGNVASTSAQTIISVTASVTLNGKTGTATKVVSQTAGTDTLVKTIIGDIAATSGSFAYATNAAAAGSSKNSPTKTPTYSIPTTNVMAIAGNVSGTPITSGATIKYAITTNNGNTGVTINENTGELTWDENSSTTNTRSVVVTATITYSGKGDQSVTANQTAANVTTITATATQAKKVATIGYMYKLSVPSGSDIYDSAEELTQAAVKSYGTPITSASQSMNWSAGQGAFVVLAEAGHTITSIVETESTNPFGNSSLDIQDAPNGFKYVVIEDNYTRKITVNID